MAERQAFGIDINEYSRTGGINYELYQQYLQEGVLDFLIIKAGLGIAKSPLLNEQTQNADLHGIPYVTYHFLDPRRDMRGQVRKYVDWVGPDQSAYILDIESPDKKNEVSPPNKVEVRNAIDELEKLTGKQPVIYSSVKVLNAIRFLEEAGQFRLWIAYYPWDQAQLPQLKTQYRYIHEFTRDFSGRIPPTVEDEPIADSVILWQFTEKGDGRHYIYTARTENRTYPEGKKSADLNISMKGRKEFMQSLFGSAPVSEVVRDRRRRPRRTRRTYPGMDNQEMIDLIFEAARPFTDNPWKDWIKRAQLEYLAVPTANRSKPYTGPKIEDLPNLSQGEKGAILALMAKPVRESRRARRTYLGLTNQDMINLIFRAALPFTDDPWEDWIVRAQLEELAVPSANRGKPYTGPRIEDLPNLSKKEKAAILANM